jgi:hypothetical protein
MFAEISARVACGVVVWELVETEFSDALTPLAPEGELFDDWHEVPTAVARKRVA